MTQQTTVTVGGFATVVTRGEARAVASTKPVRRKVQTMRGLQHHRGYVGTVATPGAVVDCGCHLHQKRSAARACAVKLAKQLVKQ